MFKERGGFVSLPQGVRRSFQGGGEAPPTTGSLEFISGGEALYAKITQVFATVERSNIFANKRRG